MNDRRSWLIRLAERFRGTGAGTEDPNIVGDVGPYDTAPGADPPEGIDRDRPPGPD
jgi:hypothetical protein